LAGGKTEGGKQQEMALFKQNAFDSTFTKHGFKKKIRKKKKLFARPRCNVDQFSLSIFK
jgi:hypothetical protein